MANLSRRTLLRTGLTAGAAVSLGPGFWRSALAATPAQPGVGPYGPLLAADANGVMLPAGFTSRVIARGMTPVGSTGYVFPIFPDGSATYATPDGGWILAVNSEVPETGGASGIRFAADGSITDAYRILENTSTNCAGGPTPWGTWLSCEEVDKGLVWECDPTGARAAVARPALGVFKHEAACVDPDRQQLYLTEDLVDGGLYRFTPTAYPDLSAGLLEVAADGGNGTVRWVAVPDPSAATTPLRAQVPEHIVFKRGEGIWFDQGVVYVATTTDETVHEYDTKTGKLSILYAADSAPDTPLRGVDNLLVSRSGDLYVAEDSYTNDPDAMDVCIITPDRVVSRFLKFTGPEHNLPDEAASETVGLCFDPSGRRLYVGSQRAFGPGVVYEISGPFRQSRPVPAAPGTPLGVDVAKRLRARRFRRRGLPVAVTLDREAVVEVTVSAGGEQLARLKKLVDAGPETLVLKADRGLRGIRRARVTITVAQAGAPVRTFRRKVRLTRRR